MVNGDVETLGESKSAGWSAMRGSFLAVCVCVCESVWSVPTWELDSRGHGYGLVGVGCVVCTRVGVGLTWPRVRLVGKNKK